MLWPNPTHATEMFERFLATLVLSPSQMLPIFPFSHIGAPLPHRFYPTVFARFSWPPILPQLHTFRLVRSSLHAWLQTHIDVFRWLYCIGQNQAVSPVLHRRRRWWLSGVASRVDLMKKNKLDFALRQNTYHVASFPRLNPAIFVICACRRSNRTSFHTILSRLIVWLSVLYCVRIWCHYFIRYVRAQFCSISTSEKVLLRFQRRNWGEVSCMTFRWNARASWKADEKTCVTGPASMKSELDTYHPDAVLRR